MRIGLHVSISGSINMAVTNAINRECSAFQIFTRNPRSWFAKDLDMKDAEKFKEKLEASNLPITKEKESLIDDETGTLIKDINYSFYDSAGN